MRVGVIQARTSVYRVVRGHFYYGWVIVGLAFLANLLSAGTGGYSLGLFFEPMQASLGWDRTVLTLGPTVRRIVNAITAPFVGAAVDRFGARAVMLAGPLMVGLTLSATGVVQAPWQYFAIYGGAGALGTAQLGSLVTAPALAKWFVRRRATAMSVAAMGVSTGGIVFLPLTALMLADFGWRMTWVVTGVIIILVATVPTFLWMRNRPEDLGLLPDGEPPRADPADPSPTTPATAASASGAPAKPPATSAEPEWTLHAAIHTRSLWLLILAFAFGNMAVGSLLLHQIPYMQERGFGALAVPVSTAMAVVALVCKPAWGYAIDRFSIRSVGIAAYILAAIGLTVLILASNTVSFYVYALLFGLGIATTTILGPIAWANYYGRRFVGTITGFAQPFQVLVNAAAPLFAAYVDDTFGTYRPAFVVFVAAYAIGCAFLFFARPPAASPLSSLAR